MKYLVISDTHRHIQRVCDIYEKLTDIDAILHLGDHDADGRKLEERLGVPCITVPGNCDGLHSQEEARRVLETPAGRILLTHGHVDGVRSGYDRLLYRCQELDCIAAFFGHTHVAVNEEIDGIRLLNPGSLTQPRDGSDGSYAVVHAEPDRLTCSILYPQR